MLRITGFFQVHKLGLPALSLEGTAVRTSEIQRITVATAITFSVTIVITTIFIITSRTANTVCYTSSTPASTTLTTPAASVELWQSFPAAVSTTPLSLQLLSYPIFSIRYCFSRLPADCFL